MQIYVQKKYQVTDLRIIAAGTKSYWRELWIVNLSPVRRFVEFQKCDLKYYSGSAHDLQRFLTSRLAATCPLVVAVGSAATRSIVDPYAANNMTGQTVDLGDWGDGIEHIKERQP